MPSEQQLVCDVALELSQCVLAIQLAQSTAQTNQPILFTRYSDDEQCAQVPLPMIAYILAWTFNQTSQNKLTD